MKTISTNFHNRFTKAFAFALAFFFVSKMSNAQICANPGTVIYALSNSGIISPVTVSTGAVGTAVNATAYPTSTGAANGIGYNTVNGLFYYFQNASNGGSQLFVSYDPVMNVYTTLASAPITSSVAKGCVSFNGTGYYCLDGKANLCYYNIPTNTWTLICSTFTDQFGNNVSAVFNSQTSGDMAIDGLGNLWIVASKGANWSLYKISTPLATTSVASITATQLIDPSTATPLGQNFVGIAFDPMGLIYVATNNDLYMLQSNYTLTHLSAFGTAGMVGDLTSCNFPFSILPVTFKNINASEQNNNSVSISWEVTEEMNNKGYYVERSKNGSDWSKLGFTASNGNHGISEKYNFVDNNPETGKNYYRIQVVDMDGAESYSEIKTVNIDNTNSTAVSVWPNPARDAIKIRNSSESYSIAKIYNQSGSLMREYKLQPGVNTINVSALSFGAYIISVHSSSGEGFNQKFIKE